MIFSHLWSNRIELCGKLKPRVEELVLSTPDIMPTLLGLSGLKNRIPLGVQGENFADYLLTGEVTSPFLRVLFISETSMVQKMKMEW